MKVTDKAQMYDLYERGLFGNKLRTWDSYNSLLRSRYEGPLTVRYKGENGGKWCRYGVPFSQVPNVIREWVAEGADSSLVVMNEAAPDFLLAIQGEVQRSPQGLTLFYSTERARMRDALKSSGRHAFRIEADALLKRHLWPPSYDDLMELLDTYHGGDSESCVVEFSAYEIRVGDCAHRNTVVWEIRSY
jgi:hypothetical protein